MYLDLLKYLSFYNWHDRFSYNQCELSVYNKILQYFDYLWPKYIPAHNEQLGTLKSGRSLEILLTDLDKNNSLLNFASSLLFTETLPVTKESLYHDRAAADQPPKNLLLNQYGAVDTSLLRWNEVLQCISVVSRLYSWC